MKTFVSLVVVSMLSVVMMQSALAESSKKMMRNDRVQYNMPKVEKVAEKKQRIMRNDRVSVIKAI